MGIVIEPSGSEQLIYKIDGEVVNSSLNDYLGEAVDALTGDVTRNGTINQGALEHFGGNQNPSIRQNNDRVTIGGSGVGGQFRAEFNNDSDAEVFKDFADDLLGRDPAQTKIFDFNGGTNGGTNRIQIFKNDEIIGLNSDIRNGLDTPDSVLFRWSGANAAGGPTTTDPDEFITEMGSLFGGTQTSNGTIRVLGSQNQARLVGDELNRVDLGASGVGGKEVWEFDDQQDAQNFLDFFEDVVDAF